MIGSPWFWLAVLAGALVAAFARRTVRDTAVLALSAVLVASWDARALGLLALWGALLHLAAPHLHPDRPHARGLTWLCVGGLLATLAGFKSLGVLLTGSQYGTAPLGLSYFTFKLVHYTLELSRGTFGRAAPATFARYLLLYPAFVAGPIERFDAFEAGTADRVTRDDVALGLHRIIRGLIKKFIVGEIFGQRLMQMVSLEALSQNEGVPAAWRLWAHAAGIFLFVYGDFAGYSDMALGSAGLLGQRLRENFDAPFLAQNVGEFWRRWHISLSSWCMEYVYMPVMGLTRRPTLSSYATMLTMAMWHHLSVNWAIWGLYHGTCLAAYQRFQRGVATRRRAAAKAAKAEGRKLPPPAPPGLALRVALRGATMATVVASYSFSATDAYGPYVGLRFLAGLFGVPLPAP